MNNYYLSTSNTVNLDQSSSKVQQQQPQQDRQNHQNSGAANSLTINNQYPGHSYNSLPQLAAPSNLQTHPNFTNMQNSSQVAQPQLTNIQGQLPSMNPS